METEYIVTNADESDVLVDDMELTLSSVTEKTVSTTKTVPYETVERTNNNLKSGESRVVQEGVNGTATVINKEIYHGTELVETVFVEEKVVTEPIDKIVEVGPENVIAGYTYSKAINVKATAYTPYDAGCTGVTATGMKAGRGVVAVDPKVIPLGSKVYVPGYGVAIAADTGGAIKGGRLDVCVDSVSEAYSWGVRNVTVYVGIRPVEIEYKTSYTTKNSNSVRKIGRFSFCLFSRHSNSSLPGKTPLFPKKCLLPHCFVSCIHLISIISPSQGFLPPSMKLSP